VGFIFLTQKRGQVVLYPKRTRFRKYQKNKFKGCKVDGTQLCFGKYGMKSCKAGHISY
jgi:large subunit ribosomal protein L16